MAGRGGHASFHVFHVLVGKRATCMEVFGGGEDLTHFGIWAGAGGPLASPSGMGLSIPSYVIHSFETSSSNLKEQHGMCMDCMRLNFTQLRILSIPGFPTSQACIHFFFVVSFLFRFRCITTFFGIVSRTEGGLLHWSLSFLANAPYHPYTRKILAMADDVAAQQQKSGKPWSGANKIPNIKEFVNNLDREKAQRDKALETGATPSQEYSSEVTPHKNEKPKKEGKTVTDPVTGNQVVIADVGKEYMARADNPTVSAMNLTCLTSTKIDA